MWWEVYFIGQAVKTSSVVGWRRSSKALSKAKLVPKKKKKIGHGHCLEICCWSDPLQLSKFQQNHYIWEVCSANQWDAPKSAAPAASISQQKGPSSSPWQCLTSRCTSSASEGEWIWLRSFASSAVFTWLLPTDLHFFKHFDSFLQRRCFHN